MRRLRLFAFCIRRGVPWRLALALAGALDSAAGAGLMKSIDVRRSSQVSGPEEGGP